MTGISIQGLHKSFGGRTVLDHVDLTVEDGEFVCLLGPSGCGKSTLLRSVAGLETPEGGSISFGDETVFDGATGINRAPEQRRLGMVFQSFALWPHKSVFDNVAYPLKRARVSRDEIQERAKEALTMVDLWAHRASYPGTLSGGQQQRVSLARAVVARPRLLLLDEPLSSLDTNLRAQMRREIRRIQQHLGATAVYVTHDKEDAGGLADRVLVLQDGKIVQEGAPKDVFVAPKTAFVAEFVGFDNFFNATVTEGSDSLATVEIGNGNRLSAATTGPVKAGQHVTAAIRSRLVRVHPYDGGIVPENSFVGTVSSKAHLGDDVEIVITDGAVDLVARVRPGYARDLNVGQPALAQPPIGTVVIVEGTRKGGQGKASAAPVTSEPAKATANH
ncbi:ABC transporter ATP-binding protein [Arthrobacter sp. TES]|uniref:ABC transporter ATP-binding protein n=1 Tax=Paenarthrobacter ureafaciens TaxID=37931 RepID=UPI0003973F5F|nr:ABC transporter ATP-binding protein [Paenarthrobacter ureafaciens]AOY73100.1 Spermidine/putrescine import ATP-binding protein PotA [Arthrobacter sp. ZXY-2]QOI64674.1 ABC transporter ATP-binding protein [Arthrobacter sp. TES]GLU59772.1 ABC transporter ATP-binding protein [Paenarthrobacter ureafaciens]GLU63972.1 ABC transporter ATP-binding protein [Paenarthrobacter ureafaciens]GLU68248.1 ABC transporter ATP-binding protein [Paenarthrobacter ureafaciens]